MWKLLLTLKVTGVVKPFEKQQGSCLDRIAYIGKRLELGDRILPLSGAGVFPSWWNAGRGFCLQSGNPEPGATCESLGSHGESYIPFTDKGTKVFPCSSPGGFSRG